MKMPVNESCKWSFVGVTFRSCMQQRKLSNGGTAQSQAK